LSLKKWVLGPIRFCILFCFILGVFHFDAFEAAPARSMYGAWLWRSCYRKKRDFDLKIHESQRGLFETVLKNPAI
jgi:hypothetical protein